MDFSKINIQDLQLDHTIEVDPSTGRATSVIAVPLSDGRNGLTPTLSLSYSSSSRNSAFIGPQDFPGIFCAQSGVT